MNLFVITIIVVAVMASFILSTLTYSLRDLSRARLGLYLEQIGKADRLEPTLERANDMVFVTAVGRLLANMIVLLGFLTLFHESGERLWRQYSASVALTILITLFCSVAIPHAAARYSGDRIVGACVDLLRLLHLATLPITKIMHFSDEAIRRLVGGSKETEPEEIEQEIMSVVEEGEKEGIVDEQERDMIESVIEFRDTQAGQIMSSRPEIVALESGASLGEVKRMLEESGHSRIPVYKGTLDHIVGVLYARDLLKHLGKPPELFDMHTAMRKPLYVPETKPLADLLQDFRLQKVHIAIVLDEYGGTAGLVTIEDILEELVGEISDEHEPQEPAMLKRIDDLTADADARIYLDELNRLLGLNLPEDAGYDTLGGFLTTALGKIPQQGATLEHGDARFTVLEAEPQKVNRVKIELIPQAVEESSSAPPTSVG